jgi:putative aminopeptidase FrvX
MDLARARAWPGYTIPPGHDWVRLFHPGARLHLDDQRDALDARIGAMTQRKGRTRTAWRLPVVIAALLTVTGGGRVASSASDADLGMELDAFLGVPAVAGREKQAADFLAARLEGLPVRTDALGNLVLRLGSGEPRRLVVCPLDEPGFVVTRIESDGYLRLAAVGQALGPLWEQAHAGQIVMIGGARGPVPGAVAIRSIHLQTDPATAPPPFTVGDAYVDVGAENADEVADLGVRLLDPVALRKRPVHLAHGLFAAPAARVKAACIAAAEAARELYQAAGAPSRSGAGSVVFAWTTLDLINGAGLDHLLREEGPFASAIDLGWGLGWKLEHGRARPVAPPGPGTGLLGDGPLPGAADAVLQSATYLDLRPRSRSDRWGSTAVSHLGLPALYAGSPVETVALRDVERLAALLVAVLGHGADGPIRVHRPPLAIAPSEAPVPPATLSHESEAALLGGLITRYGVSGAEGAVRAEVSRQLPGWAKPATDAAGNLILAAGNPLPRSQPVLFLAHLDEVGFRVQEVLADGRLKVERRGGVNLSVWEAQPALVHGERGDVAGVFEPRPDWLSAEHGAVGELTVSLGVANGAEARALGVGPGSTVTMFKQLLRLGRHRAVGRSMDDRVGSSALLLALRQLDPTRLRRQVIFAWTVGEEVGLEGAAAIASRLKQGEGVAPAGAAAAPLPRDATLRVYPVDTFVSADSPLESRRVAFAPLGNGPVLRAMDDASYAPRRLVDHALHLADERRIPVQVGRTGGATDGIPFIALGADVLPISWPGRYSHSPIEVADLRDIENLVRLIVALAESPD